MKKLPVALVFLFLSSVGFAQNTWTDQDVKIKFYDPQDPDKIIATTLNAVATLDAETNNLEVVVEMSTFDFPNGLMESHFQSSFAEVKEYPNATFTAEIIDAPDWTKSAFHKEVMAKGTMNLHGVQKEESMTGTVKITSERIEINSEFELDPQDYGIKQPSMLWNKWADKVMIITEINLEPAVN